MAPQPGSIWLGHFVACKISKYYPWKLPVSLCLWCVPWIPCRLLCLASNCPLEWLAPDYACIKALYGLTFWPKPLSTLACLNLWNYFYYNTSPSQDSGYAWHGWLEGSMVRVSSALVIYFFLDLDVDYHLYFILFILINSPRTEFILYYYFSNCTYVYSSF